MPVNDPFDYDPGALPWGDFAVPYGESQTSSAHQLCLVMSQGSIRTQEMSSPMLVTSCPNPAKTLLVNVNQAHLQGTHDPLTSTSNATSKVNYDKQTKMCSTSFASHLPPWNLNLTTFPLLSTGPGTLMMLI